MEHMNNHNNQKIPSPILDRIKRGEIVMRPRWHFVLKATLAGAGVLILVLTLFYVVSFVFFALRSSGVFFVPAFGPRGLAEFLFSFPWFLLTLSVVFLACLEVLVRNYSFAYKKPLLYSLLGIAVVVGAGSVAVSEIGFHDQMSRFVHDRRTPLVDPFYRYVEEGAVRIHPCVIISVTRSGYTARCREVSVTVATSSETRMPGRRELKEGDSIIVMGERQEETIKAFGIRAADGKKPPFGVRGEQQHFPSRR